MFLFVFPFTTTDLLNWKQSVGPYRDDGAMHQVLQTMMMPHNSNWGDM